MSKKRIIGSIFITLAVIIVVTLAVALIWFAGLDAELDNFLPISYASKGKGAMQELITDIENCSSRVSIPMEQVTAVTATLYDEYAGTDGFIQHLAIETSEDSTDCTLKLVLNIEENLLPTSILKLQGQYEVTAQIRFASEEDKLLIGIVKVDIGKSPVPAFIARPLIQYIADSMKVDYVDGYLEIDRPEVKINNWGKVIIERIYCRAGKLVFDLDVQVN